LAMVKPMPKNRGGSRARRIWRRVIVGADNAPLHAARQRLRQDRSCYVLCIIL
jgi:hypothetical protein